MLLCYGKMLFHQLSQCYNFQSPCIAKNCQQAWPKMKVTLYSSMS